MQNIHHVLGGRRRKGLLTGLLVILTVGICLLGKTAHTMAATNAATAADGARMETSEYLPLENGGGNTTVGRYQLNYTGNVNYAGSAGISNGSDFDITNYRSTVIPGYVNSSRATLTNDSGATGIVKAYLIWETRKRYNQYDEAANHVRFVMRDAQTYWNVYPDYVYVDNRFRPGLGGYWENDMPRIYCNIADVTNIVQYYGYGDYYVANIPEFHINDLWSNDGGGGQVPSAWQLVVVEEGDDFPVRAVTLKAGSTFRFGIMGFDGNGYTYPNGFYSTPENYKNVTVETMLASGLRSKTAGNVTGQVLFGSIDAGGESMQIKDVSLYTRLYENAPKVVRYAGQTSPGGGINKYGIKIADGWDVVSDLYNVDGLENGANIFGVDIGNVSWNTQLYIGAAIDLAYPDFTGEQTTTVNSSNSVTVSGKFTNTANTQNTGIYNGNLVVTLDDALTPTEATAVVNGTTTISGIISGHTVTFSGSAVASMMNGSTISYTVECAVGNSGKTRFDNSAAFHGYLRADGVDTGYWINRLWTAASYGIPKYTVTLNAGTGIASVNGAGEYSYGSEVTIGAETESGYHWKDWTGDYNTAIEKYTFDMPATNLMMTANAEANTYTIHFDSNGGGEVTPIPDMTVSYDGEVTFPDASGAYIKYTLDGVNVTQKVLDGDIVLDDTGAVIMSLDEETGRFVTSDGATVGEDGSISKVNEDGTMTVTYPDGNVVIMNPDGTVVQEDGENAAEEMTATGTPGETEGTEPGTNDTGTTEDEPESEQTEMTNNSGEMESSETAYVEQKAVSRTATAADNADEEQEQQGTDGAGTDTPDAPAAQAESEEEPDTAPQQDAEPRPDKKAYASVFRGWSLADGKDSFIPQWTAGAVLDVATLMDAAGVTNQNGATITLYAVWDDCPWIQAANLYYTLEQAQSGYITQEEILSHATASDREDGSPIAPGFHENGTSFSIPDYAPTDFTQFAHEGSCTENLTVVDSVGSMYVKQITVYVVDTTPVTVKQEGTTRFINEYYYNQPYENGGLEENSIWKTDPEYVAALETAFENSRNDTPVATYTFTHEEILQIKEFVDQNGIGNTEREDALGRFYEQFMQ